MAVMSVLFAWIPRWDPKSEKYVEFQYSWERIQAAFLAFFAYVYLLSLYVPLHPEKNMGRFIVFGIGILFVILGNNLGKIRSNYFVGIRTPWTLADEDVWNKTQRFGGKAFVLAGVFSAASAVLLPAQWILWAFFPIVGLTVVLPFAYSYSEYRKKAIQK